jgi:hypothetical protein
MPCYTSFAQQTDDSVAKHVCRFAYPLGSAEIRLELGNNAQVLARLDSFIRSAVINSQLHIRRIRLAGYCSIEGSYAFNERLAYDRVDSFRDYLSVNYPGLYRYPVDIVWVPEDWGGLAKLVRDSELNEKEEAIKIIHKIRAFDAREALLAKLNNGMPYWYMKRFLFEQLRRVEIEIEYENFPLRQLYDKNDPLIYQVLEKTLLPEPLNRVETEVVSKPAETPAVKRTPAKEEAEEPEAPSGKRVFEHEYLKKPQWAVKTNLLLLAGVQADLSYTAFTPNFALEYYISDHWSVEFGAMYAHWRYNNGREFHGISGYRLEPRYRIGFPFPNDRIGAYVGLYGRVGDYDRQISDDDAKPTVNHTGRYWDAGMSAGLTFFFGRNVGMEMGARAGYLSTNPMRYAVGEGYKVFERNEPSYRKMKITDLNVSFIYRF